MIPFFDERSILKNDEAVSKSRFRAWLMYIPLMMPKQPTHNVECSPVDGVCVRLSLAAGKTRNTDRVCVNNV